VTVRGIAAESVLKVNTLLHRGAVLGCLDSWIHGLRQWGLLGVWATFAAK